MRWGLSVVKRTLIMMCCALLVCGCAASPPIHWVKKGGNAVPAAQASSRALPDASAGTCDQADVPQRNMQLQMINDLMARGTLHAALAHLDALDEATRQTPTAQYLRADILRRTDRAGEALPIYRSLLNTCLAGEGYHGLGLIAAQGGDLQAGLGNLQTARRYLPTDAKVRNDYGYALLLDRQYPLAQAEFITAIELGDDDGRAALNYLTLLFIEGRKQEAQAFADRTHIAKDDVQALQQQAMQLTSPARPMVAPGKPRDVKASGVQP